jgi:hypothetical protein
MIHARSDYNRFQDPWGKIGEDEPVLLMGAQDDAFCRILAHAIEVYKEQQAPGVVERLVRHLELARRWRETHPTKVADVPSEV